MKCEYDNEGDVSDAPRKRYQTNTRTPQFAESKDGEVPEDISGSMSVEEDPSGEKEYTSAPTDETECVETFPTRYLSTKRFSTTSSVYASESIAAPDINQIIYCLGSVIQAQMAEDDEQPLEIKCKYPEFDLVPNLRPEYGGEVSELPDSVLDTDAPDDPQLRRKLETNAVPSVETITRYISFLSMCANCSSEVNIIALVYVNRLSASELVLTMRNWRAVWLTCIILAQKMWYDVPIKNSVFATMVPPLDKSDLRRLEGRVLQLLEYSIGVKPSLYVKYYFELRQLFTTILGFKISEWRVKPLTIRGAARLDFLYSRNSNTSKTKQSPSVTDRSGIDNVGGVEDKVPSSLNKASYLSSGRYVIS